MSRLEITSSSENYSVIFGADVGTLLREFDAVIADEFFQSNLLKSETPSYFFESIEKNKTLSQVEAICSFFKEAGLNRQSRVLAIGGGIVQDLVTMAASIYMRGITWAYVPTTLTGMMDSCLGGKSSINVGDVKNLVGNIYPPENIYIDTQFITTLDDQSLTSGLSEGVKIAFARGDDSFDAFLKNKSSVTPRNDSETRDLIELTLTSKKWFIEIDEFDKSERQLLNFGHSFGHAFEAACNFEVQHGLAVALGIIAACNHPNAAKSDSSELLVKYCEQLASQHLTLITNAVNNTNWDIFSRSLKSDKKNSSQCLVLILPGEDSSLYKVELPFAEQSVETATITMRGTLNTLIGKGKPS